MRKVLRFLLWTAIVLGVVVGAARATAIRWWRVPVGDPYLEASIAPTLRGGDLVVLWRFTKPKFGDLVLCPEPEAPDRVVIGRLIGESGDKVQVDGMKVGVNHEQAASEGACNEPRFTVKHPATGAEIEQVCQIEALGNHSHMRGATSGHTAQPPATKSLVEPGRVYLVSDNRLLPYDSRDYGQVEAESCKETVVFRLVSQAGFFDVPNRLVYIR